MQCKKKIQTKRWVIISGEIWRKHEERQTELDSQQVTDFNNNSNNNNNAMAEFHDQVRTAIHWTQQELYKPVACLSPHVPF